MTTDADHADRLRRARAAILDAGAAGLPRRPWAPERQPLSDAELVRYVLWRCGEGPEPQLGQPAVVAALGLLASARAELDQLEAGLLFAARSGGLTWPQVAAALGLGSPQAAQQRSERVLARLDDRAGGT